MTVEARLTSFWKSVGLPIAEGVSERDALRFEADYDVSLPPDFRAYVRAANGMIQIGGSDYDPNGFGFWPLQDIRPLADECRDSKVVVPQVHGSDRYFVFADYMQWSWAYAINLNGTREDVIKVGFEVPVPMASTFAEFVDLYLDDSPRLYSKP